MEEVCNKLKDTYNASILNNENTITQAVFEHISRKNSGGNKGNTTLMKLILNYYDNKKKLINKTVYNKIGGPISLTLQWSAKYNMYVYIFGEYHSDQIDCDIAPPTGKIDMKSIRDGCGAKQVRNPITKKCVNEDGVIGKNIIKEAKAAALKKEEYIKVEKYLKDLFLNTPAFIDFYLETPGYTGQDYRDGLHPWVFGTNRLAKLSANFADCLRAIKRKDSYLCRNVRVHYLDIRKEGEMKDVNDVSHLRTVYNSIKLQPKLPDAVKLLRLENDPRIDETIKKLRTPDTDEYTNFWKKQLLQSSILEKEFLRTILPKAVLKDFLEKEIIDAALRYRYIFQKYLKSWDTPEINLDMVLIGISHTVLINAFVMDMYTIARMFKKFKNVENQPERPRNIILYAGDAHSTVCRKFLDHLGFETINKTAGVIYDPGVDNKYWRNKPAYQNCVDISTFKQPFFGEYPPTK